MNAFAQLQAPDLRIPGSLSDTFASWQLAGYSYLTSASGRHDSLVGPTRELVLVASVLTAVCIVGASRRLCLGWLSTALVIALSGLPPAVALVRIVSAPAALATCWMSIAVLAAAAGGGQTRLRWLWTALAVAATVLGILTATVSILVPIGLLLGALGTGQILRGLGLRGRILTASGLVVALVAAFWLTVWEPAVPGDDLPPVGLAGIAVSLGGLVVVAACSVNSGLRPLAFGAVPILLAAVWPGPAQGPALLLGVTGVAVLSGSLLDNLTRQRRPRPDTLVGTVGLLVAIAVGVFLLPLPEPAAATVVPNHEVTTWLAMQTSADTIIEVDPLGRAQLVRDGLDPARLRTCGSDSESDFVLAPLSDRAGLPLIARFGDGAAALGLRLVVADPFAYAKASVEDQVARARYGTTLTANPNLTLGRLASAELIAGVVDARLMVGLTAAATTARFTIDQFTGTAGDLDGGTVFREATLSEITALEATGQSPSSGLAARFLTRETPYRALAVLDAGSILTVRYPAPSPFGLLP